MRSLERDVLSDLVFRWQQGDIDRTTLHTLVRQVSENCDWPEYAEDDPRSIAAEVLLNLDVLDHQLIVQEDAGAILEFLAAPAGREREYWLAWRAYWSKVDFEARLRERDDEPMASVS